ncbi:LysM peptidoglycan-binding domain-containing protein [Actinotalea solisilvae]|uniref:LysM peptidoglycan-binding domain-containing protein n=1 Tax=Actinotalea solisilvae TaxID=2072922 RepID=UPI0018F1CC62|nr:LysM peptidoglycan-binding domain-containing protein [Actinotalea solisilvae]
MSAITWDHEPVLTLPARRPRADRAASAGVAPSGASLRLTRRGRLVVWALAVAVATGVGLSAQSATADAPGAALPVETRVIAPGETLWQIAGEVAAPGADLRDVVAELVELNGLGDAGLQAGQEILVPVG